MKRFLLIALLAGLSAAPCAAQDTGPVSDASPAGAKVTLDDVPSKNLYAIRADFVTPAPPEAVWRVLSDYAGLAGIVRGLKSSRVLQRKGPSALIEQVMEGRFLIFGKDLCLRLAVQERDPALISFSSVSPTPFRSYSGSWRITPLATGCRVDYGLNVSRGDVAPRFLERSLFRKNSMDLMLDLQAEVRRRAQGLKALARNAGETGPAQKPAL